MKNEDVRRLQPWVLEEIATSVQRALEVRDSFQAVEPGGEPQVSGGIGSTQIVIGYLGGRPTSDPQGGVE